jgi:hypothetical protein
MSLYFRRSQRFVFDDFLDISNRNLQFNAYYMMVKYSLD